MTHCIASHRIASHRIALQVSPLLTPCWQGVNIPGVSLPLPVVTAKDVCDLAWGSALGLDIVFASFVNTADDVDRIRHELVKGNAEHGKQMMVVSKIETQRGVDNLDAIVEASDGIMVARLASQGRDEGMTEREEPYFALFFFGAGLAFCAATEATWASRFLRKKSPRSKSASFTSAALSTSPSLWLRSCWTL